MTRKRLAFLFFTLSLLLAGIFAFLILNRQPPAVSSLRVESFPKAMVVLTDQRLGHTPLHRENLPPGDYALRLEPLDKNLTPFETQIKLLPGGLTFVSQDLDRSPLENGGQILWLEKIVASDKGELAVSSSPDNASVFVDGLEKGKTSIIIDDLSIGDHQIKISLSGFGDQVVQGKIVPGFRLNAIVRLGSLKKASPPPAPTPKTVLSATASAEISKPYVVVKDTPIGYLRVRLEPSIVATEVGKVLPGEKYPFLSEVGEWVKITFKESFGFVSRDYVEKVE